MILSASPTAALMPGCALVTGVEDDDGGAVRLFLWARHLGLYVRIPPREADQVRRAWLATATCHCFAYDIGLRDVHFEERSDHA